MRRKKKSHIKKAKLRLHVESAKVEQGCFKADSMAALDFGYCECDFFFYGLLFLLTEPKFQSLLTLSSNNSCSENLKPNKLHIFGTVKTTAFTWWYPGYMMH